MSLLSRVQHITAACHPHLRKPFCRFQGDPSKATQATRGPEEELGKSREELRVIHDIHSGIATRAHKDEGNDENYNPQQGAKDTSATKPMGQVLRYKTHESSNMAVAVRRTPFTNPRAQSAALHGKTRPDHVHARAMAEERVDRESGVEEIIARESFNEKGSVEDIFRNCPPCEPPSAGDAKDEAEEPRISHSLSDTEPSADKNSMCDREDDKDAEQEPEEIEDETVRRSLPKGFTKGRGKTTTFSYPGQILPSEAQTTRRMRVQPQEAASVASRQAPSISAVSNNFGPSFPVRIMML